ncbi:hypothetical protein GCM10010207_86460 [Streptomyces atratus]|nr:hypothetical protein GCM10010207_86460 [Streptomyces atratus]
MPCTPDVSVCAVRGAARPARSACGVILPIAEAEKCTFRDRAGHRWVTTWGAMGSGSVPLADLSPTLFAMN